MPTQKTKYWGKAKSKYICDDVHIIFLYQQWLLAASHLTSNNMIIVPRLDADHITSAYLLIKTLFPLFHGSVQSLVSRESRIILRVPILILFCCVRHLSAVTIFGQPEVSFCSPFIERAINSRNTFFPLNSDASWSIYDLIQASFVLKQR